MEHKRKCISCCELKSRAELIKITKEHNTGKIVIQPDSKTFGRSFYICKNEVCINAAFKKNKINKLAKYNTEISKNDLIALLRGCGKIQNLTEF